MAWSTPTDAEIAVLIGTRIDVDPTDIMGVIDEDGRREVMA
jgi:hypothetical protein